MREFIENTNDANLANVRSMLEHMDGERTMKAFRPMMREFSCRVTITQQSRRICADSLTRCRP